MVAALGGEIEKEVRFKAFEHKIRHPEVVGFESGNVSKAFFSK